jgi:hypothetical protein
MRAACEKTCGDHDTHRNTELPVYLHDLHLQPVLPDLPETLPMAQTIHGRWLSVNSPPNIGDTFGMQITEIYCILWSSRRRGGRAPGRRTR